VVRGGRGWAKLHRLGKAMRGEKKLLRPNARKLRAMKREKEKGGMEPLLLNGEAKLETFWQGAASTES